MKYWWTTWEMTDRPWRIAVLLERPTQAPAGARRIGYPRRDPGEEAGSLRHCTGDNFAGGECRRPSSVLNHRPTLVCAGSTRQRVLSIRRRLLRRARLPS